MQLFLRMSTWRKDTFSCPYIPKLRIPAHTYLSFVPYVSLTIFERSLRFVRVVIRMNRNHRSQRKGDNNVYFHVNGSILVNTSAIFVNVSSFLHVLSQQQPLLVWYDNLLRYVSSTMSIGGYSHFVPQHCCRRRHSLLLWSGFQSITAWFVRPIPYLLRYALQQVLIHKYLIQQCFVFCWTP